MPIERRVMKVLRYFFVLFIFLGGALFASEIFGIDTEILTRWEILLPAAILLAAIFIYRWWKSMRLEQKGVQIQFLDDV